MMIRHAALRLKMKGKGGAAPSTAATAEANGQDAQSGEYATPRQARRIRMREDIDAVLDGSRCALVDMSTIGVQVLSPLALRPNRVVKMTLRGEESVLSCKVRVMWARFEPGAATAQYRVGVKFTDVEAKAVEAFMERHGIEPSATKTKPTRLKDSA
jgi:hypothetical protein